MKKNLPILFFTFLTVFSCKMPSNKNISDADLQRLIEREKRNEERAKYGNEFSKIQVISNPKEVERINKEIEQQIEIKRVEEQKKNQNQTPVARYKSGDKSSVPQIIKILKSKDEKARKEMYQNLDRHYDEPEGYQISEPELINTILENITIEEDEKSVIQLAGIMKLPGYGQAFEKHLLFGKLKDVDRLIYWLGQEGKSLKTVHYVSDLILREKADLEEHHYIMSGLEGFVENGDSIIKSAVYEICMSIYNRKLIKKERFEEMKKSSSSANPAEGLTRILLKLGDKRVVPIALDYVKKGIHEGSAIDALIRIEGVKHQALVYNCLRDKERFHDGLFPVIELYKLTKDEALVREILLQFEKNGEYSDYEIDWVVRTLNQMVDSNYFNNLNKVMSDQVLSSEIKKAYKLTKVSLEDFVIDLYKLGVVDKPVRKGVIEKAKSETESCNSESYQYNVLFNLGIFQWFDAETGFVPVDYDKLILQFSKNSNRKFTDIKVWMDAETDKDYNVKYKIYLSANKKIYIATPEDIGDWYDVDLVLDLLNTALSDSGLRERFVFIDTGDQTVQILFGPEENVRVFVEKYGL